MKEFELTLTATSTKTFRLRAGDRREALAWTSAMREHSTLLDFEDGDVESVEISCREFCGGDCEDCGNLCDFCGSCTEQEPDCARPEEDCPYRCPDCGSCLAEDETED